MDQHVCPFCHLEPTRIRRESEFAVAFYDGFPVAEGHTLVIPKRHIVSLFDLTDEQQAALWRLVARVRTELLDELKPDGFNIGVNQGVAAGQTVLHAHVHIIPHRSGDVADPRGGVRWVVPGKAAYWLEDQR